MAPLPPHNPTNHSLYQFPKSGGDTSKQSVQCSNNLETSTATFYDETDFRELCHLSRHSVTARYITQGQMTHFLVYSLISEQRWPSEEQQQLTVWTQAQKEAERREAAFQTHGVTFSIRGVT